MINLTCYKRKKFYEYPPFIKEVNKLRAWCDSYKTDSLGSYIKFDFFGLDHNNKWARQTLVLDTGKDGREELINLVARLERPYKILSMIG